MVLVWRFGQDSSLSLRQSFLIYGICECISILLAYYANNYASIIDAGLANSRLSAENFDGKKLTNW